MYSHEDKISRLMTDISKGDHFVMAGSMDSFHTHFDMLFDLAVHITASVETRIARINKREYEILVTES
jgi:cytidylate kinase